MKRLGICRCSVLVLIATGSSACQQSSRDVLALHPSIVPECQTPVATQVSWDVSHLGLSKVSIEVNELGKRRKFWNVGGVRGTVSAPPWAHDGYTVTLVAGNGVVIARRTLVTTACS